MSAVEITPDEFGVATDRGASTLSRIVELDGYIRAMEAERNTLREQLKNELGTDPTPIIDGEHGLVATLTERRKPASIDLGTLARDDDRAGEWLCEAARAGVLTATLTPLRALKGRNEWADRLLAREMPSGVDYVLRIEETK